MNIQDGYDPNRKKYKTIYGDPPWPEKGAGEVKRGADRHYDLMSVQEIRNMSGFVKGLSDKNCHLNLWVTNNFLQDGLGVLKAWGFEYVTCITWLKDKIGLGQYYRGKTEHCLFGVKGNLPYKIIDGERQQGVTGFTSKRKAHSEKPYEMRKMIEIVSYEPRIELFARDKFDGWDTWGNESVKGLDNFL